MDFNIIITWLESLVYGLLEIGQWFITPIGIGDWSISPLMLCTAGGLIVFLGVAVAKWIIS